MERKGTWQKKKKNGDRSEPSGESVFSAPPSFSLHKPNCRAWSQAIDYEILFPDFSKFCFHLILAITNSKQAKDSANDEAI